jgi:GDP-L-fucose synthase
LPNILVFGANGFVGKNLIEKLSALLGKTVVGATHADADLLDNEAVGAYFSVHPDADIIIHCVSFGGSRLTNYDTGQADVVEQNLRMFFNVARCIKPHQRLICLGSGAEYDRSHYLPKMPEEYFDTHVPADAYGFSKYVIAQFIAKHKNMLDLRIFGLYGQGEEYRHKFISNAIVKGLLGLPITIAQNVVFDYLYINDFVRLVNQLLDVEWPYRHMNITPTQSIDLFSIAQIVNEATGNCAGIEINNPGWNTEYTGDNTKLLEILGPFEFTPYPQGIHELTNYYRSVLQSLDIDTIKTDPYLAKCIIKK